MTQEEKARAYDEALERAMVLRQEAIDKGYALDYIKDYETIFPELAESEDERIRKAIIGIIKNSNIIDINVSEEQMLAYLEKQKEQKPVEWSEEDEKMISKITDVITGYHPMRSTKENEEMIAFLKSLRPQQKTEGIMGKSMEIPSNWKPSEEQMIELRVAISGCSFDTKTLSSLYNDLKKLM